MLWSDDAVSAMVRPAPVERMHGAIVVANKMDLGFYAPVCAGEGTCLKRSAL